MPAEGTVMGGGGRLTGWFFKQSPGQIATATVTKIIASTDWMLPMSLVL